MGLLFTEGFDWLQSGWNKDTVQENFAKLGYNTYNSDRLSVIDGRFGGQAVKVFASEGFRKNFYTSTNGPTEIYFGVALKSIYNIDGGGGNIRFLNDYGGGGPEIAFRDNGQLLVSVPSGVSLVEAGRSPSGLFGNDEWFYLEGYIRASTTSGQIILYVDGNAALNVNNVRTVNSGTGFHSFLYDGNGPGFYAESGVDDFYIVDKNGWPDTWLGQVRIQTLFPDGAGDVTQLSPSSAGYPNWQLASNININDTSYVYGTELTSGNYDLYQMTPLLDAGIVYGVKTVAITRQSQAAPPQLSAATVLKTNGSTLFGTTANLGISYRPRETFYALNPVTSAGWSIAEVNNIQIGPKQG